MKLFTTFFTLLAFTITVNGQVKNEVSVYVRPGTEVHIFENLTNTGNFTMDEEALLYVDGGLINNNTMTFENAASLMRGSAGSDGTGSGTYYVRRQGTTNTSVFNYWSSPMTAYANVPGASYLYNSNLSTQDFSDDLDPDPGWISYNGNMVPGKAYTGRGAGLATFSGDVNNGNVSYPLTYYPYVPGNTNPGTPFNLCGNPYPSAISCAALVAANPDVNGSIYFWDDDLSGGTGYSSSDYAIWNGTGTLGTGAGTVPPNGFVSTGQGFMIRALNYSAVLDFTNAMRVASPNTQFFSPNGNDSRLWFSVGGNDLVNQILIGVLEDATDNEDRLYDAVKVRGNTNISLAATSNDRNYAILAFPPPSVDKTIPLSLYVSEQGTYTFKANTMEGFSDFDVYFTDTETSTNTLLEEGTEINVSLTEGEYEGRFFLNFVYSAIVTSIRNEEAPALSAYAFNQQLHVILNQPLDETTSLQLFDMQGRLVLNEEKLRFTEGRAIVPLLGLSKGAYVVRLLSDKAYLSQKILKN